MTNKLPVIGKRDINLLRNQRRKMFEIVKRTFTKGDKIMAIDYTPSNQSFPEYFPSLDYDKMVAKNTNTGETKTFIKKTEGVE